MSRFSAPFPEQVGRYELLAPIGAGGMATVYLGVVTGEAGLERQVAVKMIHGTVEPDSHLAADLLKEAKLAARICHPNVVPVLDVGEDAYGLFLVMEYVEGDTLAGLRRAVRRAGERIPDAIALRVVTDALAGLHAAHELKDPSGASLGVVHRDFSPHNILVGTDGVSRLTDFGIAKVAYTAGHTRTGKIKGKIAYMAPEQARGVKVDRRCDVWAAGVVAWEALVGERLHDTEDEIGTLLRIVNEDPPRLKSARPDVPDALDEAVRWALTRELDARCPTADALRRSLLSAGAVADTAEVAEWVRRVAGPKLVERARKVEAVRRRRGRVGERNDAVHDGIVTSSPADAVDAPGSASAAGAEPDEPVTSRSVPRDDTTGATIAWKEPGAAARRSATGSVAASVRRRLAALGADRRQRAALIGVASGASLSLLLLVIVVSARGRRVEPEPAASGVAVAAAAPTSLPEPASSAGTAAALAPTSSPRPAPSPETVEALPPAFIVKANADIAALEVGGRRFEVSPAAPEVGLDVRPGAGALVEAVATDGRRARATVVEGSKEIALDFGRKPAGGAGPARPPHGPAAGFAENPYRKK